MSAQDAFDVTPSTPSPAPRTIGTMLHFPRPARGKKSSNDLKKAASSASMREQANRAAREGSDSGSAISNDDVLSRSASPTPSALSAGNTSQLHLPSSRESGLDLASEALQKLMEDAHNGSFAAGALGQKFLDQQEHMRQLMQQLEEASEKESHSAERQGNTSDENTGPAAGLLLEKIHRDITQMKEEQEDLMRELLQASNADMGAISISATSKAEAEAIIRSYGGLPDSNSYNSLSATPTKPASSNARELRRLRNAAAPNLNKDEALVNDIQQQLINELRRLQALVAERDKALAAMSEGLEEAARFKAIQEGNIKKLETEKDAKDAHLYEAERKEAMAREENEDIVRQLKKHENEVRLLRRQLGEKTDVAESLKVHNEEMELKVGDMLGNLATLRAKGAADQMTINGLKSQVGDLEVKHRQAVSSIPPSSSNLSSTASYDHGSSDFGSGGNETVAPDGPLGRRSAGHHHALTPSASLDDSMVSRLRSSETVKGVEAELAKWKGAALKYRKKWTEERRQVGGEGRGREQEYDDSTDEDEDEWMDDAAKTGEVRKRSTSSKQQRIISSTSSRKSSKTMGDAFGIQRHNKRSSMTWEDDEGGEARDHSLLDDDASSNAASSTRGSLDGFDPHFADPTIRSGADSRSSTGFKRRSTYTPASIAAAKGSPLARQLQLPGEGDDDSSMDSGRPSSVIYEPGALGDELAGLQSQEGMSAGGEDADDSLVEEEDHLAAMEAALADRDTAHEATLAEREAEHQRLLAQTQEAVESSLRERETAHQTALSHRDGLHQEQLARLNKEHAESMAAHSDLHTKAVDLLQEKHVQLLASRNNEQESFVAQTEQRHEEKLREVESRQARQHEEAMTDARQRHADALGKAREEAQTDLVVAQREHKRLLDERQQVHRAEVERLTSRHDRAIMLKEQEHRDHIGDIETTHNDFHKRRDEAFGKMLTQHDDFIKVKEGEISTLRARLSTLETELEGLRQKVKDGAANDSSRAQALQEAETQLEKEKTERAEVERRLASLSEGGPVEVENDEFEDAMEDKTMDGDHPVDGVSTRRDTASTRESTAVETPWNEAAGSEAKVPVAERREERAAQTDEDMWARYQHEQLNSVRPPSSMLDLEDGPDSAAGPGGILVMGGQRPLTGLAQPSTPSGRRARDSISTFGGNRAQSPAPTMYTVGAVTGNRTSDWSRRPSYDSTYSAKAAGEAADGQDVPPVPRIPDRSKPPTISVPPPPVMPPPPSVKQETVVPAVVTDEVPEAATNPVQGEETIPTASNKLRVPARPSSRVSGPPPSALRPSRNSLSRAGRMSSSDGRAQSPVARRETDSTSLASQSSKHRYHASVRAPSAQSFASDVTSEFSRASGVSSRASDYVDGQHNDRTMLVGPGGQAVSTDPMVLGSITQTMIGDYLYKYTRRSMGRAGHSGRRHRRYFWVHPYTRTLYWTLQAPSEAVASEAINKSAFIQDVLLVEDTNNTPPGLYHMSILVMTQAREVKITAPTREKHEMWITALSYLVNRDSGSTPAIEKAPSEWRQSINRAGGSAARLRSQTSGPGAGSGSVSKRPSLLSPARSFASVAKRNASVDEVDRDRTPRARGYSTSQASTSQRRDTAAKEYLEQWENLKTFSSRPTTTRAAVTGTGSLNSARKPNRSLAHEMFGDVETDPRLLMSAEEMLEEDNENNNFDGLDNVRACCDGKHDVGALAQRNHHHHHHHASHPPQSRARSSTTSLTPSTRPPKRPTTGGSGAEGKPLKLTSAAPQLGPLNLNTIHHLTSSADDGVTKGSTSTQASSDFYSASEHNGGGGRVTPSSFQASSGYAPASPKAPSYSDRIAQIRKSSKQPLFR